MIYELSYLHDVKANCHSYLCTIDLDHYLNITQVPYEKDGGIEGQRSALNTQSGRRIRKQMVEDFKSGGVLPPVVIGIEQENASELGGFDIQQMTEYLGNVDAGDISILDGMQRTTAMIEAKEEAGSAELSSRKIRVEFWISEKLHSLLYRMLVLNTGQVPWSLRRQVEVVFHSLRKEMVKEITRLNLLDIDNGGRRTAPGSFHANKLIEVFLITGTRSERIDVKEKLADDFLKLDFIENASDKELTAFYFKILQIIVDFDFAVHGKGNVYADGRFSVGLDLFSSQPVLMGFCVAISQFVFGRPGVVTPIQKQQENLDRLTSGFKALIDTITQYDDQELSRFCAFDILNEQVSTFKKSSKVGDDERSYFKNAFKVIIEENFKITSLEICWRV